MNSVFGKIACCAPQAPNFIKRLVHHRPFLKVFLLRKLVFLFRKKDRSLSPFIIDFRSVHYNL